jgi:leader peptidase (prepilin peptidase) / N-methyltransferase
MSTALTANFAWLSLDRLFLILASPLIGSFLGVVAARLPKGESIVFGRSACPACSHQLAARDLAPFLSWMLQRRRCRYCGAEISVFYPGMEAGALLVALSAAPLFSGWLLWVSCAFGWTLLTLAAIDLRYMILPDVLTLPLIPAGLAVAVLLAPETLLPHAVGAIGGYLAFVVVAWSYRKLRGREGLGMGDAKLLAASGAWVSALALPYVVFLGAITGLLVVLAAMARGEHFSATHKMPLGTYLCLATWLVWLAQAALNPAG